MKLPAIMTTALALWAISACAQDQPTPERAERAAPPASLGLEAAKADAPGWFTPIGPISSNVPVLGRFEGADSAHLYRYEALAGQLLALDAEVDYAQGRGLVLAVYGPSGELIDYAWSRASAPVSLEVTAERVGTYEIGVFSWSWRATGTYKLSLSVPCGSRGLTSDCGERAFCMRTPEAICGWADAPGVCTPIPIVCTDEATQVCGCDGRNFTNTCRAHQHGISVQHLGPCEVEPTDCTSADQCAEGLSCQGIPQYMPAGEVAEGCCTDLSPLEGQGESCSADADCGSGLLCVADQCSPEWMAGAFRSEPGVAIPDNDPEGISEVIVARCLGTVPVDVSVDVVIHHTWIGDLTVAITDPSGSVITVLHDQSGGSADDLILEGVRVNHSGDDAVNGPWTLNVVDSVGQDTGTLVSWTLHLTSRWD